MLFISHNLGVIAEVVDEVMVMYGGQEMERTHVERLFDAPAHPYTRSLLEARPTLDRERTRLRAIPGQVPSLESRPAGCPFHPRCDRALEICARERPASLAVGVSQRVACWLYGPEDRRLRPPGESVVSAPLVEVENLRTFFRGRRQVLGGRRPLIRAVDGVSLSIRTGESYALVGESGCGKSTTGRSILRLVQPTSGSIVFGGRDVLAASRAELRSLRRQMQMVFQDPYSSLDPRMRVQDIVAEPLIVHRLASSAEAVEQARRLLDHCGIPEGSARRLPRDFSGGQRQRIGIARALVTKPSFIVADEPVSSLDVSIQAQILNLLQDLQAEYRLTYLFISHDLAVVRCVTDRIGVMYLGKLVEETETARFFAGPLHPYSRALLSSVPRDHPRRETNRVVLSGSLPSAANPPSGCRFHTRCPEAVEKCRAVEPVMVEVAEGHRVACHLVVAAGRS